MIITECFKCGARYKNYFYASPCCRSIILKVDENGQRSTVTFLSTLSLPQANFVKVVQPKTQQSEVL